MFRSGKKNKATTQIPKTKKKMTNNGTVEDELNCSYEVKRRSTREYQEGVNEIVTLTEKKDVLTAAKKEINGLTLTNIKTNAENMKNAEINSESEDDINIEMQQNVVNKTDSTDTHTYVHNSEMSALIKILTEKYDNQNKNNITIEGFAKVVPDFDGSSIPVRQWVHNFNENAEAYELSDKQKYVNARNKMSGTAKLYLETITVSNYELLCAALIDEFDKQLSSAEVHKMLQNRKKRGSENFHEYVLQMRKIAALGHVEDQSIISYVVDGLEMRDDLKFPLYSACSFKELLSRYELIETVAKSSAVN